MEERNPQVCQLKYSNGINARRSLPFLNAFGFQNLGAPNGFEGAKMSNDKMQPH